jgi:hypothetical protein
LSSSWARVAACWTVKARVSARCMSSGVHC